MEKHEQEGKQGLIREKKEETRIKFLKEKRKPKLVPPNFINATQINFEDMKIK